MKYIIKYGWIVLSFINIDIALTVQDYLDLSDLQTVLIMIFLAAIDVIVIHFLKKKYNQ